MSTSIIRFLKNLGYLLVGLPLGTLWFTLLVTGLSVAVSLVVVALVGIPLLVALGSLARWSANVERSAASALLGCSLPPASTAGPSGNPWVRLKAMAADADRRRELWFLALRFPVGVATSTVAAVALGVPAAVAAAPFTSSTAAAWLLLPVAAALLVGAVHVVNGVAGLCARWTNAWLA